MATETILQVSTRQLGSVAPNGQYTLGLTTNGALMTTRISARYAQLAAAGMLYSISAGVIANAQAPITQIPTTAATWALYNGATVQGGGYVIVPLRLGVWLASGVSAVGASLLVGVSTTVQAAAITNATGIVGPKSNSASTNHTSTATLGVSATLAGAPAWVPVASFMNHVATGAAIPGSGVVVDLEGAITIPPHFAMGIEVFSGTGTTALYAVSVIYAEIPAYLV